MTSGHQHNCYTHINYFISNNSTLLSVLTSKSVMKESCLTCALVAGGLPKDSTEDRYWESIDGEELPREPESRSPGKPWNISLGEQRDAEIPAIPGKNQLCDTTLTRMHINSQVQKQSTVSEYLSVFEFLYSV